MAAGDPYFDCDNNHITLEQVLRDMVIQDAEGNPAWRTNAAGGGGGTTYTEASHTDTVTGTGLVLPNVPHFVFAVYLNGQYLTDGVDYTIASDTITFTNALASDSVTVTYNY